MQKSIKDSCQLCGHFSELQESHILPAFVFRWVRKRGITGHMRSAATPNRRSQDGLKQHLLCKACEEVLGNFERSFSSYAFYPALNDEWSGEYRKWLLKFCVSVSWRIIVLWNKLQSGPDYSREQQKLCMEAEEVWKDFLLDECDTPKSFVQHLVLWPEITRNTGSNLPNNINRYLSGAVEMDVCKTSDFLATYAKLGSFMIFGIVQPGKKIWHGTQVKVNRVQFFEATTRLPKELYGFIKDRAIAVSKLHENLSDTQKIKIESDALKNFDNIPNTPQFASMMADAKLFGMNTIVTKK